jgi:hypothetical protein
MEVKNMLKAEQAVNEWKINGKGYAGIVGSSPSHIYLFIWESP